jgi:glycosyltransferase involved in cell wall biosynthesis
VSVVVPCYNLGPYLAEAVDSVLAQSFTDVEILVVDDGSTEPATRELLDGFDRPRTRVLRIENRGLPGAKNVGLRNTTGELLCMLDADDVLEPDMLRRSVMALDADPSIAFASHWLRTFGEEQWEWTPTSCEFPALLDMNTVNGSALMRRTAIEAVGGFDETFLDGCEDWDLWITMVERGLRGVIIPEFLFRYRRRTGSMSQVMMQGDTHPALYRRLVAKHAGAYRAHLEPLLVRREREEAHLRGQIHDLELDDYLVVTPELTSARDDLRDAERWRQAQDAAAAHRALENAVQEARVERDAALAAAEHMTAERDEARASAERLAAEEAATRKSLDDAESRYRTAEAVAHQAMDEVAALRRSWSWRLTAPLRSVLDVLNGSKARR